MYNQRVKGTKLYEGTLYPELSRQIKQNMANVLQTINSVSLERKKQKSLNFAFTTRENFKC